MLLVHVTISVLIISLTIYVYEINIYAYVISTAHTVLVQILYL